MDYQTEDLILHYVTEDDLAEVARTWLADHHPLSDTEVREAIAYMRGNYERNTKGRICHLCLAVCGKEHPGTIMGWCGLDVSTKETHRGKKLASACIARMKRDCMERGITVHWDAQNEVSRHLAEKFGFEAETKYSVYWV